MTPMQPPQRPGMPPQRPGMPPQRPGMLPAPQGGMPFQSPSTPPPTGANGIAGAFQGVNPAKAGYDVGTAAIMANQRQGGGMPGQLGGQPQANLQAMDAAMLTQARSAQGGMGLQPQQMQGLGDTAQRQIALANLSPAQQMQQLQQQGGMPGQLGGQPQNVQMQQLQQQGGMGGMPGQLGGQGATVLNEQQFMQRYGGMQPQMAMQTQLANQFANPQSNSYAAQLANQFGAQGSMGLQPQTQANLGGAAGSLQQSLNAARAVPAVAGMSAPPGQQVNMFGAGAPMPQQQAPAGANFGVGPFGPGMGVQGGVGTGMQGMSVGAPTQAQMANRQPYTPR